MTVVILKAAAFLLALAVEQGAPPRTGTARPDYREIAVDRVQHFVVATPRAMRDRAATVAYARRLCGAQRICFVHFWTSAARAGRRIPMTDRQADAIVASYNRNLNTGNDGFQCYNFGSAGERC